jgi:HAD superfamily hydrolase (TIGR01509 family)
MLGFVHFADVGAHLMQLTTILFDCDNTLVLSEELAFEACAELANEILAKNGVADRYTGPQLLVDFVGQNFRGMLKGLMQKYSLSMPDEELNEYVLLEETRVIRTLEAKLKPCIGVDAQLEKLNESKKYLLAVVSSSALRRVKASVKKVGQDKYFDPDHIFSAATSLPVPTSKPDPAIYIFAAKTLGKEPGECVAVEDSKSGTLSAVRAGIPVIAYVGSYEGKEQQDKMGKFLLEQGAKVVMEHWDQFPDCLAAIEK